MKNQTIFIGENHYYWNEKLQKWIPENRKFEDTK